jgi:AraC-like DNA-binding protein
MSFSDKMFIKVCKPQAALREFVNNITVVHPIFDKDIECPTVSIPPMPEKCLFFYPFDAPEVEYFTTPKKEVLSNSIIIGRQISRIGLTLKRNSLCIKVGFQPSGLYRLLGMPLSEYLIDGAIDGRYLLDKDIVFINEQLQTASSYDHMVHIVEAFLLSKLKQLRPPMPIDIVLTSIIQKGGLMTVDDMASTACISFRQLERQFQQRMGMSPKFFARLTRFAHAWGMKQGNPKMSWTDIAYQCGYFDQMHFIRDFKEFAGVTPSVIEVELKGALRLRHNQVLYD